jgi:serine/threonine-protein phosphatase 2A regulatory subunit B''
MRDIQRSELLPALKLVDEDDDINKELRFFSYEHFYVIYCKFWELDSDHDLEISRDELLR